jgi:hypothetical protein
VASPLGAISIARALHESIRPRLVAHLFAGFLSGDAIMTHQDAPESTSEVVFTPESEHVLQGRAAPHRRFVPIVVTALVVVLVLALVARQGLLPGVRPVAKPTPFPHVLATISLHSTVNYGTLTINGQPSPTPFFSGMHLFLFTPTTRLTLSAPPFRTISCTLSAPTVTATGDGCQATPADAADVVHVTLTLTLADLPPDQEAAALQAANTALSQAAATLATPLTVPPGEYYATKLGSYHRTPQALQATIAFATNFTADCPQVDDTTPCQQFDISFISSRYSGIWGVNIAATFMWRFQTADGQTIIGPQVATYLPLLLAYNQQTGWSSVAFTQNGVPNTITHFVMANLCDAVLQGAEIHIIKDEIVQDVSYTKVGIAGCDSTLVIVAVQGGRIDADVGIIVRFGVALAAYSLSQQVFPTLPLATPADIAAVDNQ